jgi:hypothetical protein
MGILSGLPPSIAFNILSFGVTFPSVFSTIESFRKKAHILFEDTGREVLGVIPC